MLTTVSNDSSRPSLPTAKSGYRSFQTEPPIEPGTASVIAAGASAGKGKDGAQWLQIPASPLHSGHAEWCVTGQRYRPFC